MAAAFISGAAVYWRVAARGRSHSRKHQGELDDSKSQGRRRASSVRGRFRLRRAAARGLRRRRGVAKMGIEGPEPGPAGGLDRVQLPRARTEGFLAAAVRSHPVQRGPCAAPRHASSGQCLDPRGGAARILPAAQPRRHRPGFRGQGLAQFVLDQHRRRIRPGRGGGCDRGSHAGCH